MLPDGGLRTLAAAGKCLDLSHNVRAPHAVLQLWDCNGSPAQRWALLPSGAIALEDDHAWVVDLPDGAATAGTRVQLLASQSGAAAEAVPAQRWTTVAQLEEGSVALELAAAPGRCLAVLDSEPEEDAWLEMGVRACGALPALQRWTPAPGGGTLTLAGSSDPTLCVDLAYFNMADGAKVQLGGCNGMDAQKWALDARGQLTLLVNPAFCLTVSGGVLQLGYCHAADRWVAAQ